MTGGRAEIGSERAQRARGNPEADLQRQVVAALRPVLPRGAIVHHSANEQRGGGRPARLKQAIAAGMGVHPGFADLVVISEGRVLFLELKAEHGRLAPEQLAFRDTVRAQGLAWALVRSLDDAFAALAENGFGTRVRSP